MTNRTVAGWSGIGAFVTLLAGVFIGGEFPDMNAPPGEIVDYFADAPNWAYSAQVVTLVLVMLFAASLYSVLRATPAGDDWSTPLLLISAVIIGATVVAALMAESALMIRADAGSEDGVSALLALSNSGFMWSIVGIGVFLLAAWRATRAAGWPAWLGYVALLGAVAALVGLFFGAADPVGGDEEVYGIFGFIGFVLWGVWLLLAGIVLLRGARTTAAT